MKQPYETDHIDPRWEEGREYQLVCGMDVSANFIPRETSLNTRKSNRFLPWRVCDDELGGVPVHPGDLCQFLHPETGEWVLEEFLGEWWFERTRTLCGQHISGTISNNFDTSHEAQSRRGRRSRELGVGIHGLSDEQRRRNSILANQLHREKGTGWFDSELQRELASRPRSEKAKKNVRESNSKTHGGTRVYNNGVENRRFKSDPGGEWVLGSMYKWFTNGEIEEKFIPGEQPKGWVRGRIQAWGKTRSFAP